MVTQYLTISKNIQSRFIRDQQKLFTLENCTSKTYDYGRHVSRPSWKLHGRFPPGISILTHSHSGPEKHDYLGPQQLNKKFSSVERLSSSIAFQQYTV